MYIYAFLLIFAFICNTSMVYVEITTFFLLASIMKVMIRCLEATVAMKRGDKFCPAALLATTLRQSGPHISIMCRFILVHNSL